MIVVDSSAVIHLALRRILARLAPHGAVAPALLRSEVASALRQLAWRRDIADADAREALAGVAAAPIRIMAGGRIPRDAYEMAARLGWAKTYDAEYLVLAERFRVPLLTTDARLARTAERSVGLVPLESI